MSYQSLALFFVVLTVSIVAMACFTFDQWYRGRFTQPQALPVDRAWAESGVMELPAEVAGAALDDGVDLDDVKAIIARLVIEKKLEAAKGPSGLKLKMLVPFQSFTRPADLALIRALFVRGDTVDRNGLIVYYKEHDKIDPYAPVDTETLAAAFGGKSFSAAKAIEEPLLYDVQSALSGNYEEPVVAEGRVMFSDLKQSSSYAPFRIRDVVIWIYVAVLMFSGAETSEWERSMGSRDPISVRSMGLIALGAIVHVVSMRLAARLRKKVVLSAVDVLSLLLPILIASFVAAAFAQSDGIQVLLGFLFTASIVNVVLYARFVEDSEQTKVRSRLRHAADFLRNAIDNGAPIHINLVPYAFAFGLGARVKAVRDEDRVEGFRNCGGVARFNTIADDFLQPFQTVTND